MLQIPTVVDTLSSFYPSSAHEDDAGYDLRASRATDIAPGDRALIETGVHVAIPDGYAGLILPRSGLAIKHGVTVLNAPGLIDSGYRGEIRVALVHLGLRQQHTERPGLHWISSRVEPYFNVHVGDRIAQLLIVKSEKVEFVRAEALDGSARGDGGFGSTGV